ncbi:alpha/beta hydrolase [Hasllibacter sp. MH4015]|uniref:alpha/beta hydrolase n=1 Tax=Hasllibacter sp. MH4015 TaxID=2854029 RepID=UPI001CD21450|nr:alpha/beta hydrolase [Hasllibacter sp. MH4015]
MLEAATATGLTPAPFDAELARGPAGAEAWWVEASDGTRLRFGVWPGGEAGTVLMFPGRTEYVEKYGLVAEDLAKGGYTTVAFDWRGQGLADRPPHDRGMGHVEDFEEYQRDVKAFVAAIEALSLPKPWYLIGHSMGGCIGLRALYNGLDVAAAAFTGPMWGLQLAPFLQAITPAVMAVSGPLGLSRRYAPTTGPWTRMDFDDNTLTTDRAQFDYMFAQTDAHPEMTLGGPSFSWVKAALVETAELMALDPLDLPVTAIVGSRERIVAVDAVETRMASWPGGKFVSVAGAEHEVLMENPARRGQTFDEILGLFAAHPA